MISDPEIVSRAASFDWETLVPIIFFILYGIAQFLGGKKKGAAGDEEGEEIEVDPLERARQIREEIRRKIEERRQASEQAGEFGGGPVAPQPRPAAYNNPTMTETSGRQPLQRETTPKPAPIPQPVIRQAPEPVLMGRQQAALDRRLEVQRANIEKARQEQKGALEKANRMVAAAGRAYHTKSERKSDRIARPAGSKSLRGQLLTGLRDPNGIRKAVLYREILDPPLGLR